MESHLFFFHLSVSLIAGATVAMVMFTYMLLLIAAGRCAAMLSNAKGSNRSYQSGDITLGGLFLLHYATEDGKCGELFPTGLGHVEAMLFAIDKINKNPKLLPNITLGYDIRDYCESITKAMKHTYSFVRRNEIAFKSRVDYCSCSNNTNRTENDRIPMAAVIGPTDSGSAVVVGSLLEVAGIPVISHSATSNELSSPLYRHFFRTASPDSQQANAMADVIQHFNWSFVIVVAMDDSYGRGGVWELEKEAERRKTFCIAFAEYIPRQEYSSKLRRAVNKIKSYPHAKVVVLWLFGSYGRRFLNEAVQQELKDRTWILSDALATEDDVFVGLKYTEQKIIHGSLGIQPRHLDNQYFKEFVIEETNGFSSRNRVPWWEELWQSRSKVNCSSRLVDNCQDMLFRLIYDTYIPYVVDAVFAVGHALHLMLNCSDRVTHEVVCPDSPLSVDLQEVERYLRKVDFFGLTGRVSFDSSGDPVSSFYDIVHFYSSEEQRQPVKIVIGSWERSRNPKLLLNDTQITWNAQTSGNSIPRSFCQDDCLPGTFRSPTTPCCWKCTKCSVGMISITINSAKCQECPKGQKPNQRGSSCIDLPEAEVVWTSLANILVLLFSSIGIASVAMCSIIFYKHRNTPVVKAANRELSCILMITIALSFSMSIFELAKRTNFTCRFGACWRSSVLATFIAILIIKTMKILSAFRVNVVAEKFKKFILMARSQTLLVLALISVQLILVLLWVILDPPSQRRIIKPVEGKIHLSCSLYQSQIGQILQILMIVYMSFLAVVCTFYAFKARNLPENFNEGRYIVLSMYILLLSSMGYYPVDIGLTGSMETSLACASTLLSSYGLLVCMFGPKIYFVLCKPEQNTHEALCSQVAEFSFSSGIRSRVAVAPLVSVRNSCHASVENLN